MVRKHEIEFQYFYIMSRLGVDPENPENRYQILLGVIHLLRHRLGREGGQANDDAFDDGEEGGSSSR